MPIADTTQACDALSNHAGAEEQIILANFDVKALRA